MARAIRQLKTNEGETMMVDVEKRVLDVVGEKLSCNKASLSLDSRFAEDLKADANAIADIAKKLSDELKVAVSEDDAKASKSVGQLVNLFRKQVVEKTVIEIVSEQMGVDRAEITRDTHFINDLNADSLDTVELVMEFEDEFELSIPDEEAERITTVGHAMDYIKEHKK